MQRPSRRSPPFDKLRVTMWSSRAPVLLSWSKHGLARSVRGAYLIASRCLAGATCAALVAACSGGGGSPAGTSPGGSAPAANSRANVTFQMQWAPASPASASSAFRRSPKYLAPTALSVSITVVSAPSPWTTATPIVEVLNNPQSTLTFSAPTGLDTFSIQTYDEAYGKGAVLSSAIVTQTVSAGSANVVAAILDGVINSFALSVSPLQPTAGSASTMTVSATAYDADGNAIVGPGTYASAVRSSRKRYPPDRRTSSRRPSTASSVRSR